MNEANYGSGIIALASTPNIIYTICKFNCCLHYIITIMFAVFFYTMTFSFVLTWTLFILYKKKCPRRSSVIPTNFICLFRTFCRRETREIDDDLFRSNSMSNVLYYSSNDYVCLFREKYRPNRFTTIHFDFISKCKM